MKFLIAGLGSIGRRHLKNLVALGESDILLYRTHQATLPEDDLAGFPIETDLRLALAHNPEAVIISNPTSLHLDVAIQAAMCGCHLLIEKPISHSMARVEELEQAVQLNRVRVLMGYQFRFNPGLRQVKKLLEEGALGEPLSARAHWGEYLPNWHPWEDYKQGYAARPDLGGGVVLTLSHPLDYLRWLLGEVATLVAFTSHTGLNMPVEDLAEIGMRFNSGLIASLHLDYIQRPPSHTLEIIGTQGTLGWDNADSTVRVARASPDGETSSWQIYPPPDGFERNSMFLDEMRHFIQVVRGEAEPLCSLQDGIMALRLAQAARQQQRIQFSPDPSL
jgi:predicted dehydrogenase